MEIEHTDGSRFDFYDIIILVGIIYDSSVLSGYGYI